MALGNALALRPKSEEPSINITSMMDMFTIIVFFLLFSYSAKPQEITLDKGLDLPASSTSFDYSNSVKLFLSDSQIKIEDQVIASMINGTVVGLNEKSPKQSSLYTRLAAHKKKQVADNKIKAAGDPSKLKTDFHVLFFCDRNLPFKTMNSIMKVAAMAGYPNFQLAVLEK